MIKAVCPMSSRVKWRASASFALWNSTPSSASAAEESTFFSVGWGGEGPVLHHSPQSPTSVLLDLEL